MKELNQAIEMVLIYLQGIWLRRRYIILTAWLVCPVGWLFVFNLPPTYQADAKLYVETRSVLDPVLAGLTFQTNPQQQVELMARTLLSRPNLEKIARATDLDVTAKDSEAYEGLIDSLKSQIKMTSSGRENIYVISYSNASSPLALKVVQETLNTFVESQVGNAAADNKKAAEFLDQQIKDYEQRLSEAESRLSTFKKEQINQSIGNEQDYYARIEAEKQRLAASKLQEKQLTSQLKNAQAQLEGEEPVSFEASSPSTYGFTSKYDSRIAQLEAASDELLIRYTENHPDVIEIRKMIAQLEEARLAEMKAVQESSPMGFSTNLNENTVYQELRMMVARLQNELTALQVVIEDSESKLAEMETKRFIIPDIEAKYAGLNRDYEITKGKYEELLSRREAINLSQQAEQSTQDVQFKVIEPPRVPINPSGPNRVLFYNVILAVGFMFGVFMAFVRSQLQPVVTSALQLKTITDFPVFGLVSHIDKANLLRHNRKHLMYFLLLSGALVAGFAAFVVNEMVFGITTKQILGWLS